MRIGVLVDSTCDLPEKDFRRPQLRVMPISIRLGERMMVDERDRATTQQFYAGQIQAEGRDAESIPFTSEQIQAVFLERLVLDYDLVFCITVSSRHSPIFDNATRASFGILKQYRSIRAEAGQTGPFSLRVIDSRSLFAGTGVLVSEVLDLIDAEVPPNEIRLRIDDMVPTLRGYMVPADLAYVRDRGFRKNDRRGLADTMKGAALSLGSALAMHPIISIQHEREDMAKVHRSYDKAVRNMLESIAERIQADQVTSQSVCLSYSGDIAEVPNLPGYEALYRAASDRKVQVKVATMSATGAVNVGAGCLFAGYAGAPLKL